MSTTTSSQATTAVLLDVPAIQQYVFASNRLRENVGASYIIEQVLPQMAQVAALQVAKKEAGQATLDRWWQEPDYIAILQEQNCLAELAFQGGGKIMYFFRTPALAKEFVRHLTRQLLVHLPGLRTAIVIDHFHHDQNFANQLTKIFQKLTDSKNSSFPVTTLTGWGITAECPTNNLPLDYFYAPDNTFRSYATAVKALFAEKEWQDINHKYLPHEKAKNCVFAKEVDKLGQTSGMNYLAVVYIDGNDMGHWFKASPDLADYRKRCREVVLVTEEAFRQTVEETYSLLPLLQKDPRFKISQTNERQIILPLRPLVLGGDDITFLTDGRLGLFLTEKFLAHWCQLAQKKLSHFPSSIKSFSASAGIAIVHTKYPFFRAYQLAETLCSQAKLMSRYNPGTSWVDIHIARGHQHLSLPAIRREEYRITNLDLYFGPYLVEEGCSVCKTRNYHSFYGNCLNNLKQGIVQLANWPSSQRKKLHLAYSTSIQAVEEQVSHLQRRNLRLPGFPTCNHMDDYSSSGHFSNRTPYRDMLEMVEFYPPYLLNQPHPSPQEGSDVQE
ncbi:MAG: Cas10/Cmr2 second palm domain-containing protein [Desulfurispora sp.]|uniref:Cas10/Cmr2 second palm domain-containing protein n=1 Tax=Desulfurispora sp. TaxID=3014275 RepID=UPI004049AD02